MSPAIRQSVGPAYLALCLILGGSAQGVFGNLLLQLCALAILAWAAIDRGDPLPRAARHLAILATFAVALVVLELVPLPPALWSAFPGRQFVADGFALIGQPLPWLPWSLAPYDTLSSLPLLLPPLALLAAFLKLRAYRRRWVAAAIVAGTLGGVLLGIVQVSNGEAGTRGYLYPVSNFGYATGFFANANHMAALLVCSLPFLAAAYVAAAKRQRSGEAQRRSAIAVIFAGIAVVIGVGVALNGSLAGYGLVVPAIIGSAIILMRRQSTLLRVAAAGAGIALAAVIAALYLSPTQSMLGSFGAKTSVDTRRDMAAIGLEAAGDFMPLGSGIGTFPAIYVRYEDPATIDPTYVVHAHNDYLEWVAETGVPGALLLVLFLLWWGRTAIARWREASPDPYARAAIVASAVLLAHSLVDFPLRTAALAGVMAACFALIADDRRRRQTQRRADLRPTRHVAID